MKYQMQWAALVVALIILVAGSLGCATMAAESFASRGERDFYYKPVLSDEIVAIGRPDAALTKAMGQTNVVAFVGKKNTYMLYKGGEELERISQLKLDGKRMEIDAVRSHKLFLKDKQVWGELVLSYGRGGAVSDEEKAELGKGGFTAVKGVRNGQYQKKVNIEGVIYPAISLTDEQRAKLTTHRAFNLYNPRDAKPPVMGRILRIPIIAAGVAADIVLTPVYLGVGVILLVGASTN